MPLTVPVAPIPHNVLPFQGKIALDPCPETTMAKDFDVTVVGASFAGLACAQAAARRGLDVLVLEARRAPTIGLRTTGILVQEAAAHVDLPPEVLGRIEGVRLYAPSLESVDLTAPGYAFYATDLPRLMHLQAADAVRAGVDIRWGTPFRSAIADGERITIPTNATTTRFLVGADGARSRVARSFGLGTNRRFLNGLEYEYEGVEGVDAGLLHVFIDAELAPGYIGWVVPGPRVTQVGLAARQPVKVDLERFLRRIEGLFDFSAARRTETRGGVIPVGGRVDRIVRDRVVLLGDAAGTVSPLTAGGIHRALELGPLLGDLIADGAELSAAEFEARAERELTYPRYRVKRLLRLLADHQPHNAMVDRLFGLDFFRAFAQLVFFHQRGLLSRDAWRDLRRLFANAPPQSNEKPSGQVSCGSKPSRSRAGAGSAR